MDSKKYLPLTEIGEKLRLGEIEGYLKNALIEKVVYYENNKSLEVVLLLEEVLDQYKIETMFKDNIEGISKVIVDTKYVFELEDKFKEYRQVMENYIRAKIPSISDFLKNIKMDIKDNTIIIKVDNEIVFEQFEKNNIKVYLEEKIDNSFKEKYKIQIDYVLENNDDKDEYIKSKNEEERDLLAKITENIDFEKASSSKPKKNAGSFNDKSKFSRSKSIIKPISETITEIDEININSGTIAVEGEIFDIETKEIAGNKKILTFGITDFKNSISGKLFLNEKQEEEVLEVIKLKNYIRIKGDAIFDTFARQLTIMVKAIEKRKKIERMDESIEKRVELHSHTKMSSMDGFTTAKDLIETAVKWGHKSIAITDHGVVQSFPEAMYTAKGKDIKIIYGVEGYLVDDKENIVYPTKELKIDTEYIVFDIETTGFSSRNDEIIEIGAVKIKDGVIVEEYSELIDPQKDIPYKIIELTGITNEMVKGKPKIEEIIASFLKFIGNGVLVAHNASFDMAFIREKAKIYGNKTVDNPVLDTLGLSRVLYKDLKNFKLNTVSKYLGVELKSHHRAVDDSKATSGILLKSLERLKEENCETLEDINRYGFENKNIQKEMTKHIIIFAKNYQGLKNLYKIISESHLNHFFKKPRIPKTLLEKYREGIILGTACESGELYGAILRNESEKRIEEIADFYDFLEIQPIGNNEFLIRKGGVKDDNELRAINKKIVELGDKLNKKVVATGDVHFLNPEDEVYRRILMVGQGFSDGEMQGPFHLKTTNEMLEEFSYLGKDKAKEVVIENTNYIADLIENIDPIPEGTYPPKIEGAEDELKQMTYNKAKGIYGEKLPEIVKERLDKELNSIIKNGYAVMYIIAQKLVQKSLNDGYLVGSRGSVGSSFAATMSNITEVNPLPPHYICKNCKHNEFILDGSVGSGIDLKDKNCPKCGTPLLKEGHDIPFEVFLGFEGDKEPDIDLNFAGEYQAVAHKYTEELFGEGYVFRAGTIGTIAEKTAYGFVKKYFENKEKTVNPPEINRLVKGCSGVKRTSGQHPGGIMVVPDYKEVYDFTPIQHPADDSTSGVITTHFDYNAISGRILKLDILGHDVPSIIRMLEDITGINPQEIDMEDEATKGIFIGTETLGVTEEDINSAVGTMGVPEFGTKFVRQMLLETKPTTFAELVRISGLSHGTDVWINNAQNLVKEGRVTLKEVICTRDDIMNYLILKELDKKKSFKIMEKVRKGIKPDEDEEKYMLDNDIPKWYVESCKKIKYMFPKAHAVAYVMMSVRIAFFKVHHPEAFYATYFTTKAADFDGELIIKGKESVKDKIKELEKLGNSKTAKEKNLLTVLEVALEMYARNIEINKIDLYKSDSDKFTIVENIILPPLKSLDGVGENLSRKIVEERENGEFISIEDLVKRTKATKTAIEALNIHGCLEGMQNTNQLDLFNI